MTYTILGDPRDLNLKFESMLRGKRTCKRVIWLLPKTHLSSDNSCQRKNVTEESEVLGFPPILPLSFTNHIPLLSLSFPICKTCRVNKA